MKVHKVLIVMVEWGYGLMPRKYKRTFEHSYNESHLLEVQRLMNERNMGFVHATRKAGFSDSSLYYLTLKRLGWKKLTKIEYIMPDDEVDFL